ncbi:GNAT family N-acetyltransferase [Bacteroides salyersiae]|nr:GNAT family N-acetyltransferase [Bacteroides salyersiae]
MYASYRNHGYMTEALKALCKWAFDIAGVQSVIAETEKDNIASQYVLQKSKMKQFKESADSIWWKLNKKTMEKKEIIVIRQETKQDRHELYHLIQTAFQTAKVADGDERGLHRKSVEQ